ncbi:hypothetical protein TL16_g04909 [Triparma laevis f. inornata]|uniref:Uncharacterized protein n=1 Tax=Triparma laevis f. inornata TaxID=1714386 RepID=A0A9W7E7X3_9STRA|nr:hypothetical protein TL16_g04909 [Triparma laevis f. inornata]
MAVNTSLPSILALNSPSFFGAKPEYGQGFEDFSRSAISSPLTSLHGSFSWLSSPLGTFSPNTNTNTNHNRQPSSTSNQNHSLSSISTSHSSTLDTLASSSSPNSTTSASNNEYHYHDPFTDNNSAINEYLNSIHKLRNVNSCVHKRESGGGGGSGVDRGTAVQDLNPVLTNVGREETKAKMFTKTMAMAVVEKKVTKVAGGGGSKSKRAKTTKPKPAKATKKVKTKPVTRAKPKLKPKAAAPPSLFTDFAPNSSPSKPKPKPASPKLSQSPNQPHHALLLLSNATVASPAFNPPLLPPPTPESKPQPKPQPQSKTSKTDNTDNTASVSTRTRNPNPNPDPNKPSPYVHPPPATYSSTPPPSPTAA